MGGRGGGLLLGCGLGGFGGGDAENHTVEEVPDANRVVIATNPTAAAVPIGGGTRDEEVSAVPCDASEIKGLETPSHNSTTGATTLVMGEKPRGFLSWMYS